MLIRNRPLLSLIPAFPAALLLMGCSDAIYLTSITTTIDSSDDTNATAGTSVPSSAMESTVDLPTTSSSASSDTPSTSGEAIDTTGLVTTDDSSESAGSTPSSCGDGMQGTGEECDHGPANADNLECTEQCTLNVCGDGFQWNGVEACDGGGETALCNADCTPSVCGDGVLNAAAGEACDDANVVPIDGCEDTCQPTALLGVYGGAASEHMCVVVEGGNLKCWGNNDRGQLGYKHLNNLGDDEPASAFGFVDVGGKVVKAALGSSHTCALLDDGSVRCWGYGKGGRLGLQNTGGTLCLDAQQKFKCAMSPACCIGDDENPGDVDPVELGGKAADIVAGATHTCARLESGTVRCWGDNYLGALGLGYPVVIGDDDPAIPNVPLNGSAEQLYAGQDHNCAVLSGGALRCWGYNGSGQLGLVMGDIWMLGDDEGPIAVDPVVIGGNVISMALEKDTTCAIMDGGKVRCWGLGGTLGSENGLGTGFMPPPDVDIGDEIDEAEEIKAGAQHVCARLLDGTVRCWGYAYSGKLGNGTGEGTVGDELGEMPPDAVKVGGTPVMLAAGGGNTCVILAGERLKCWGDNTYGTLGYGHAMNIGDDPEEMPSSDVTLFK